MLIVSSFADLSAIAELFVKTLLRSFFALKLSDKGLILQRASGIEKLVNRWD